MVKTARNEKILAHIQDVLEDAIGGKASMKEPAKAVYDRLFTRGLLRLDAFEAR